MITYYIKVQDDFLASLKHNFLVTRFLNHHNTLRGMIVAIV